MTCVNENVSKQNVDVMAGNLATAADVSVNRPERMTEGRESGNLKIARRLREEKASLINALSQFPVTALWLLNEYEQQCYKAETDLDDEIASISDLTPVLSEIKKTYSQASQSRSRKDPNHAVDLKRLQAALQQFPYSFQDLTGLVDFIAYTCKLRGLCRRPAANNANTDAGLVLKRLEGVRRRRSLHGSRFVEAIRVGQSVHYDEPFLFLPGSEMQHHFIEMAIAEHNWLHSREELSIANSRLVLYIANQYKGVFLDFEDLVQEGQTGLLKAVDRYDCRLGFKFSTYAGYWIRQAISRALSRSERVVRIPCGQIGIINKVFRAKDQLLVQLGREPTVKEVAEYTQLTQDEVNTLFAIAQAAIAFEAFTDDDNESFAPADFLEQQVFTHPFIAIAQSELEKIINKAIDALNPREVKVICGHFGVAFNDEMTLKEIGSELNLTRERVRQIQVMALDKIKRNYGQQLMSFL